VGVLLKISSFDSAPYTAKWEPYEHFGVLFGLELRVETTKKSKDRRGLETFLEACGLSTKSIERAVDVRNAEVPRTRARRKKSLNLERLKRRLREQAKD
jgi:hypothetical protein